MATEIEIRNALRNVVAAAAPEAIVLARDILNVKQSGWLSALAKPGKRVRGWMVTQSGYAIFEQRNNAVEYQLWYDIWQFFQYRSGENTSNSEDEFSAEREAVIAPFINPDALDPILSTVTPLEFPQGTIGPFEAENINGLIHLAKGRLSVNKVTGC